MCRLAAYLGPPGPLKPLVFGGPHSLYRQSWDPRELRTGSVNADGWGVVWPDGDGGLVRLADTVPIWHTPDLAGVLGAIHAPLALAALRNATPGLPIDRAGALPMVHGRWAMAMNGYLPDFRAHWMRRLRSELADEWYGRLRGSSDAETLFLLLLQTMEAGAEPAEALLSVRRRVASGLDSAATAPLTLLLMGQGELHVLHSTLNGPTNSLYLSRDSTLVPEGGVLVASEPFTPGEAWEAVPGESLVEVSPAGVAVTPLPSPVG
jgi:glutamine amidotransferase